MKNALELSQEHFAGDVGVKERGAVFTRRETVDFILNLVGYVADQPLYDRKLVEPSCGHGSFLVSIVERLLASWRSHHSVPPTHDDLKNAIRAFEVDPPSIKATSKKIKKILLHYGVTTADAERLLRTWIHHEDYLLALLEPVDFVVGNPPYVRQELIPPALLAAYRDRYETLYDRADLYVPFIERSLKLLGKNGSLGFICADRWMKNKYGGPLRRLVSQAYHLRYYVDMYDTPAFESEVSAYPAIFIINREKSGTTRIAYRPEIEAGALSKLAADMQATTVDGLDDVREVAVVGNGTDPWILDSLDQLEVLRKIEARFPILEEAGCKVGIGVATGADAAYIAPLDELDVEPDRKLPLVRTHDIKGGKIQWKGMGVINPYGDDGKLVDLKDFPKLKSYLEKHREKITKRHCAKRDPSRWYRTIDRIYPELVPERKLLVPDIKGEANIVYDSGKYYPHHNLYYIVSNEWDLRALQAVLKSGIARLFVSTYSTKMRGGYLRYQAQYLRRICIPKWSDVPAETRKLLISAAKTGDSETCNEAVLDLYQLTQEERAVLGGNGA